MGEIRSHTALRGIASLLVVAFHYRGIAEPAFNIDTITSFFSKGYLWVDCFFMLSGFILCHRYGTRPGKTFAESALFLKARFARIYPLHLATLIFFVGYMLVIPKISHQIAEPIPWTAFWLSAFDIQAWGMSDHFQFNYPSWSISVEFFAYLLFPAVCLGLVRQRPSTLWTLSSLVLARLAATFLFDLRTGWETTALLQGIPMFGLGIILFQSRAYAGRFSRVALTILQTSSLIVTLIAMHLGWNDAIIIIAFAVMICAVQNDHGAIAELGNFRALGLLGAWSYSVYLLHIPILRIVQFTWPKFIGIPLDLTPDHSALLIPTAAFVMTIVCSWISFDYFEMPIRRFILSSRSTLSGATS